MKSFEHHIFPLEYVVNAALLRVDQLYWNLKKKVQTGDQKFILILFLFSYHLLEERHKHIESIQLFTLDWLYKVLMLGRQNH